MTTPRSTASNGSPAGPRELADPPEFPNATGVPGPGLPDVATLAALANEFFSALPGEPPLTAPVATPKPDVVAVAPPEGRPGGGATGWPAAPTAGNGPSPLEVPSSLVAMPGAPAPIPPAHADVPVIDQPSPFVPSTPYYFLGEASALQPPVNPGFDEASLQALLTVLPATIADDNRAPDPGERYFIHERAEAPVAASAHPAFDVNAVRRDFPILSERVNGRQLVWLDNAATTQKPQAVIDRLSYFYAHENSNIHRAAHELAARATDAYEAARSKVARFIGAGSADEIVFVRGTTEGINLVAQSWGRQNIHEGDEIIISHLEHHANIVPWQQLVAATGAKLKVIPVDSDGQILLDEYQKLLSDRTKLVSVTQVSNALGTITPVRDVIELGHRAGACVLIDGAQSISHLRVDVQELDADFFVFSGHKIYGPTGIGAVYGKAAVLEAMPPWQGGGNMIADVTLERALFQPPPARFEAGTGNIADAVGLGAALDYLERLGIENVARYEHDLLTYAMAAMRQVSGLRLIGTAPAKASVLSFVLDGYTTEQVGQALSREGIAVRAGHHCAQPILRRFGLEATVRPSLAMYNTCEEIDHLVAVLHRLAADSGRGRRS